MSIRFGALIPQGWRMDLARIPDPVEKYETMTRVGIEAEEAGFDSIWLYDHFHTVPTPELEATFECWTSMAALARDTKHVKLGQMVTCNGYRPPALLAKMASCVDVMSHGRLMLGIGSGWYQHEFDAYGFEFGDAPARLRKLREALQVIKAMWTEDHATFEGSHYRLAGAINEPKPLQRPHPPIWIGGGGEKVTLKLVAQYGDACNFGGEPAELRRKLSILRSHCEAAGRDYDTILKTTNVMPDRADRPEAVAEMILERAEAGVEYFVVYLGHSAEGGQFRRFAEEVIPLVESKLAPSPP
jgi:F420-dependent oxidoreductase-like protein